MLNIYIDADACSVKNETYKVAARYQLVVYVVANQYINVPMDPRIQMEVVSGGFDAADDWIVEQVGCGDIVITSDLLLADRCIKKKARVVGPKGNELDEDNIGPVLGARELATHLRTMGDSNTGPSAMGKNDRSRFLSKLDQVIQAIKKEYK